MQQIYSKIYTNIQQNIHEYTAKACEISLTTNSSSSFEAAMKLAYHLHERGLISTTKSTSEIFDLTNGDRLLYDVFHLNNQPVAELRCIFKNPQSLYGDEMSNEDSTHENTATNDTFPFDFDHNKDVLDSTLLHYFGFESFRPLQRETIESTLKGENVMTVVGTGGGKSMMYLLPAVLASKPSLVVSPTKSLIDDLLLRCGTLEIPACKFTADVPKDTQDIQLLHLKDYKIILTTPEMLSKDNDFYRKIVQVSDADQLDRIVVDEAHTVVTWGDTFRPLYQNVCKELAKIISCPILLLSASVTVRLEARLHEIFGDFKVFRSSVLRPNLYLEVKENTGTSKLYSEITDFILSRKGECGIIYCVFPNDVSKVHAELLKRNISCVKYHGKLAEDVKHASYRKWIDGEVDIIVANASFGMGIDKANVRYVIHARLPTSIDDYFQQCGRAGRDGQLSVCLLFYNDADKHMLCKLFEKQGDIDAQLSSLNDLIVHLENPVQCRHQSLMCYFGEQRNSFLCETNCDNCRHRGAYYTNDGTADAFKVVQSLVELTGMNMTCKTLKLFLSGSRQKCMLEKGFDSFKNFGVLQKQFSSNTLLSKFLHLLISVSVLAELPVKKHNSFSLSLILGRKAHDLLT
jgi:RecQ family ATP-dependent DNA helicase